MAVANGGSIGAPNGCSLIKPSYMPHTSPLWAKVWFAISTLLVIWDCGYLFLRPRSMPGGDLHWMWPGYQIYSIVDYVYGWPYYNARSGFPLAQATLNVFESILNIGYLVGAFRKDPAAVLIGFAAVCCTWSKTVLYALNEHYSGFAGVGHNSLGQLILYYILPNGLWLLVPGIIIVVFGRDIVNSLRFAAAKEKTH